ncbi:MAG: hypothetical protein ACPG32_01895 [Akkermansiaceae bacterium]
MKNSFSYFLWVILLTFMLGYGVACFQFGGSNPKLGGDNLEAAASGSHSDARGNRANGKQLSNRHDARKGLGVREKKVLSFLLLNSDFLLDYSDSDTSEIRLHQAVAKMSRDDLNEAFDLFVKQGDYPYAGLEAMMRRWGELAPDEAAQRINENPQLIQSQSNRDYFVGIVCVEMAEDEPRRAAELMNKICQRSQRLSGAGFVPASPYEFFIDTYQRIGVAHPKLAFELAMASIDVEDATVGAALGALAAGEMQMVINVAKRLLEDDQWRINDLLAQTLPRLDMAAAQSWYDSLSGDQRANVEDEFNEACELIRKSR